MSRDSSDAIQMQFRCPPTPEKIWVSDVVDGRCIIGSGDHELARDVPEAIGLLMASAPEVYRAALALVVAMKGYSFSSKEIERAYFRLAEAISKPAKRETT